MSAIRPISVADPVAVTTTARVPRVTCVFWNTRLVRSPSTVSASSTLVAFLRHRRALTGQRRLLELQRRGGHDPAIRRDDVTGLEQRDIARHQLRRFDLLDGAIAAHPGMRHLQLRECLDAGPRLQLLGPSP